MRIVHRIEVIVFMSFLILPTALWVCFPNTEENLENRTLASFPTFDVSQPTAFVSGFEEWYTDHLPFKQEAVRLQNTMDYHLFRTTSNSKVMVGDDGWLFYSSVTDGDPIADYKGLTFYDDEELADYATSLMDATSHLANQDIDLYMLIAPNKEIAYQRYMPKEIVRVRDKTRSMRLVDYLTNQGIDNCVYLDSINRASTEDDSLYRCLDTHWNLKGAYLAYQDFCNLVDSVPAPVSLQQVPHTGGDLANMLNMSLDEPHFYENTLVEYETDKYRGKSDVELFHSTRTDADPRKVLILGDSFREDFKGFVAAGFANTASMTRDTLSQQVIKRLPFKPDIILILCPERYVNLPREVIGKLSSLAFE